MSLDNEKQIEQTWGSHKPLLFAIMEVMQPSSVIECGCGNYSTPIIQKNAKKIVTIEHDAIWSKRTREKYPDHNDHDWIIDHVPGVNNGTRRPALTSDELEHFEQFYMGLDIGQVDFLFVDTFACARVPALKYLSRKANLCLLHDLEPNSPEFYCYEELGDSMNDWHRYRFAPEGWINKVHRIPWTDIFSHTPIDVSILQPVIDRVSNELWGFSATLEKI